ncbi:MAG: hypothetical protein HZT43_04030 [Exiguobacterium profundum]|nr:MAG: hypothetical protein HZT43_04030 [Exiguobacterium profundum]
MGYSTPKKPFDLGEFLSEKGSVRSGRKPTWQRRAPAPAAAPTETAGEAATPGPAPAPRKTK